MRIAHEGRREILISTALFGGAAAFAFWACWPLAVLPGLAWVAVLAFFRDPRRVRSFAAGELCAAADGRVTEIAQVPFHEAIGGPALRIGVFLSLFNVHVNRSPCSGRVMSTRYTKGEFLDARHPESGARNESNTMLIDPDAPLAGPIEVRQVAGFVARRIVSHATAGRHLSIGERFGMIKFGSRTELLIPDAEGTEILVKLGDRVYGGLTVLARQKLRPTAAEAREARSKRSFARDQGSLESGVEYPGAEQPTVGA